MAIWEYIRWMVWVDLEGFGHLYRDDEGGKALWGVRCLMRDLFRIGSLVWPEEGERLFMHQVGDGFVVKPDFGDIDLLRPLTIGTALLRAALMRGYCLKVGIGLGGLADVRGCYPEEIMDEFDGGSVSVGTGLMTVFPVMGDGLIDAHGAAEKASGPLLTVRKDLADAVPADGFPRIEYHAHFEVDWIHATPPEIDRIMDVLNQATEPAVLKGQLREYLEQHHAMGDEWRKSAELLIRGYGGR